MVIEVEKYIAGISIGVRFGPSFSFCDEYGTLIDNLLYTEGSYFDTIMFPNITPVTFGVRLDNLKTGNYLLFTNQDIILNCNIIEYNIEPNKGLKKQKIIHNIKDINDNFQKLLEMLKEHSVDRIRRLGYVNKYIFDIPDLVRNVENTLSGSSKQGVSDIESRFSKRYPVLEAQAKKDINNYHNVIYSVWKKPDAKDLTITLDYQEHYEPNLENTGKIGLKIFLEKMEEYNKVTFSKWLAYVGEK